MLTLGLLHRLTRVGKRGHALQISDIFCCFVLQDSVSQTKYCYSLKFRIFAPKIFFGTAPLLLWCHFHRNRDGALCFPGCRSTQGNIRNPNLKCKYLNGFPASAMNERRYRNKWRHIHHTQNTRGVTYYDTSTLQVIWKKDIMKNMGISLYEIFRR